MLAPEFAAAGISKRKLDMNLCTTLLGLGLDLDHEARVVFESKTDKRDERSNAPKLYLVTQGGRGVARGSFGASKLAVQEWCEARSLIKTSDMESHQYSDGEDSDEDEKPEQEQSQSQKIINRQTIKGAQRYQQLGPEGWQGILKSMLDKHADASDLRKHCSTTWTQVMPLFLLSITPAADFVDLIQCLPKFQDCPQSSAQL